MIRNCHLNFVSNPHTSNNETAVKELEASWTPWRTCSLIEILSDFFDDRTKSFQIEKPLVTAGVFLLLCDLQSFWGKQSVDRSKNCLTIRC